MRQTLPLIALSLAWLVASPQAPAKEKFAGYLCCNMRSYEGWISDSNYVEDTSVMLPAGTPVSVVGYGGDQVKVRIDGKRQDIGNDYSRDLDIQTFARRYVVAQDPREKIAGYPARIQSAIAASKVTAGMSREQVLVALGYPMASENPDLQADTWKYWLQSFTEFHVLFAADGTVRDVDAESATRRRVWLD
ncbi:outer membrane protein assembly factor BamE [Pseudoxanthomonas sp.]|uniref:outer membrane protein assembly factor BamE domain-containing protein n=1 Tax=Pseudoxanthomonas sp. TaxID=1871049 RepID=UPI0026056C91|nr:outer membrane protein assembly factor BamE [Pseudoxanthomonas sp.]WDS35336.1 MAG: outer membrane protein assembly factor BamE [Pseudoxanthomonas sp.]